MDTLRAELAAKLDLRRAYAVRSSANLEDRLESSFAGQFKSHLNARGVDDLLQSIWSIWATSQLPPVQAYMDRHGMKPKTLRMGSLYRRWSRPKYRALSLARTR
jgi:phosphoenolpyruvate synthase/pyruvate phosphate dikinase